MTKTILVDVDKSTTWHTTNGRLTPADAKETAKVNSKRYICPVCHKEVLKDNKTFFGAVVLCECGNIMEEQLSKF